MAGLRKIARMHGGIVAKDSKKVVVHKWDYDKDEPYVASETDRNVPDEKDAPKP